MSCRIMEVTAPLRQFAYKLGKDYMPGDYLFAPHEEDLTSDDDSVRVTTKPHEGDEVLVPKSRLLATNFVAEEQPPLRPLMPAARPVMAKFTALAL